MGGGLESLVDALWRCPIPTAPSPPHVGREGFGLTLLALALRLEHVGRISETLSLVDSTHMARSVTVDVDRGALTAEQRDAVRFGEGGLLCVPIARLPRRDLAAVVVRDAAGRVLPRSTRVELPLSLAEGLNRAFEMLLDADPRVDEDGSPLHRIRTGMNRARWLVRDAITTLVENGPVAPGRLPATPRRDVPGPGASERVTRSAQIRQAAEDAVRTLFDDGGPFPDLLEIAATEHIVLAEVEDVASEVFLTYEAPLIPASDALGAGQQARRIARGAIDEFTVEYRAMIPRAVDSYHVTIEVPPEISIRRFFLTSNVDAPACESLRADMHAVADAADELAAISSKLLELELQSIASRLAEFGRRRAADLATVEARMPVPARAAAARSGTGPGNGSAADVLVGASRPVDALARFAGRYEADGFRKLAEGSLPPDALHRLADELADAQVDRDVVLDNDPRDHAGHAHWRRRPFGAAGESSEPVVVAVHATLRDDPPSLSTNVWRFLVGILALVLGAGVLLFPSWRPFDWGSGSIVDADGTGALDSADALVTVLLLVPGLLLARLDIPRRASVLGTLRRVPQLVAYTAVFVTAALALVVATAEATVLAPALLTAVLVLVALILAAAVNEAIKARRRRVPVPNLETTPRWLVAEYARRPGAVPTRPTVTFSTVELSTRDGIARTAPARREQAGVVGEGAVVSARHRPSDLARVAARSAVAGASTVRFDVAHLLPGVYPAPDGPSTPVGPPRSQDRIREALSFAAAGIGVRVRTWTPEHPEETPLSVDVIDVPRPVTGPPGGDVTADLADPPGAPEGHEYAGHSAVNPSFLYDQTASTEILLTLSPGPWRPDLGDCRMVGLAVEALTRAAAEDAVAPILLLQSPVAPFREPSPAFRKDGSGEEPRAARGTAIRMSVGLDENRPDRRLAMLRRIAGFAGDHGLGLQLSDSRLGRAAGDWWTVLSPDEGRYRAAKAAEAGAHDGVHPTEVRVVTFVGPARIGSSAAIVSDLVARKVGVLAVTTAALQEISFVHAVLPVAPVRTGRGRPEPSVRRELGPGIGHLARDCGLAPRSRGGTRSDADLAAAVDYCVLESGPVPLADVAGGGTDTGTVTAHPVWVSWTLPAGRSVPEPVAVVLEQVGKVPEVASASVDYARVRRQPDGRNRGRAKLSVVLSGAYGDAGVPGALSSLCSTVQTASLAQCRQAGVDVGRVDLRVVWRERWLGAR